MKKQEIKGLSAFKLLDDLDDDMILSASLPEATPVPTPTAGERMEAFFGRMGRGGMAAAVTGLVVAAAVLIGILLAGRFAPAWEEPGLETEPGPVQSRPNIDSGILYPPLTETPDNPQKNAVSVVSDGITVYPKGYCVYVSEQRRNEKGELEGLDGDGFGAVYQLAEIWDELPTLRTAGNSYALNLPKDNMSLRGVRIFETVNGIEGIFEELALPAGAEGAADVLKSVTSREGEYVVVLEIYHETIYSADEYTKGVDEYAFRLTVDPSMNDNAPVRVIHGDKTYFPTGYLLEESYYDAELGQDVTKRYDGATYQLSALIPDMVTVTLPYTGSITQKGALSLYLAPFYDLKEITVYDGNLNEITKAQSTEPLEILGSWGVGDYYVIISATFAGTGATSVTEFPIHIKIVEEREEESTPAGDVGETPLPPRVQVGTGWGSLYFGNTSHSREYHEGYMLWIEMWDDGGMLSGDGLGAMGQLAEIADGLPTIDHDVGDPVSIHLPYSQDTLTGVSVYDKQYEWVTSGQDASVLTTLPGGSYIVVLTVVTQGDYIPEAETYERTCTQYAFRLAAAVNGSMGYPETNPRVVVSGGGQSAVFATEEEGFLAWREVDLSHIEGTRATDVIFADDDAMRALPKMEITYGDTLTLTLDAAGDDLIMVYLYDAKGGFVKSGADLSVVNTLQNEGWDQHVIVILEIHSLVSNSEQALYEYAFELYIVQP